MRAREGFEVVVIEDACRGIDVDGSIAATRQALADIGAVCVTSDAVLQTLSDA
jgi:nicotinamidase/pyrazinamidase